LAVTAASELFDETEETGELTTTPPM
jgi:hypothetical protein